MSMNTFYNIVHQTSDLEIEHVWKSTRRATLQFSIIFKDGSDIHRFSNRN